jgi:hypothetical protein
MKIKKFILLLAIAMFTLVLYYGYVDDKLYAVIEGKIYRSAQLSAHKLQDVIHKKNIKTIINLRGAHKDEKWYRMEREIALKNKVKLYNVALPDHDLPKYQLLNALTDILMMAEKPLLLYCWRGADRTGMASALALSVELDLPLSELVKQFSWRYGVVPFMGSIGPRVFSSYKNWLNSGRKAHSRKTLLYWIKNVYVDAHGNVAFWIDSVNNQSLENRKMNVKKSSQPLLIKGWAYDSQNRSLPDAFYVIIAGKTSARVNHRNYRPDAAQYLGLKKKDYKKFLLGWEVLFQGKDLSTGCHQLSVKFSRKGSDIRTIPTGYQLCIE